MTGSSFGTIFRITNWGESHGKAIGVVIDGCPSGLALGKEDIQKELDRRRPGQSNLTTPRKESDGVEILSGVFEGKTTGTPISLIIYNEDKKSKDYSEIQKLYRPGHADFTYDQKYGHVNPLGGGRSSARVTAGSVAAGAIAKKILKEEPGIDIMAYVTQIKEVKAEIDYDSLSKEAIEQNTLRCPDTKRAQQMEEVILEAKNNADSVGGIIECIANNLPAGLGEPIYDKLEADLAKAMLSINASKGFEIGSGFNAVTKHGSEQNDEYVMKKGLITTRTNNSGGIQGGISNGMPLLFRVAFKPTSTIGKKQDTVTKEGMPTSLEATGRHDPCVLPRAVPIVEAMTALVLADHYLLQKRNK